MQHLAKRIRQERRRLGWNQTQLASFKDNENDNFKVGNRSLTARYYTPTYTREIV